MENTSLLLKVNGETYPVRSCAIKSILERARISGHALNKVSKKVFTQILNYCMDVASGDSLIKIADDKVSAVHGGDPKDYAVLEMLPLVQCVQTILDRDFSGNHFLTANFDHAIVTAIWSLDGQADELMDTYRKAVKERGITEAMSARPGLRFTTSDVGVSAANLYPILLIGGSNRIVPLGDPLKLDHKNGANLETFESGMDQLYACFKESIERQQQLMDVDIRYPYTTLLGVLKRIGITKKLSYEVADLFEGQNGVQTGCNAYQLYLAMSDVIFLAQCEGASGARIAQLEENVARALRINWHEYDRPGDFKW